jgi:hypothetical protein
LDVDAISALSGQPRRPLRVGVDADFEAVAGGKPLQFNYGVPAA